MLPGTPALPADGRLLTTMTREPFQPVRLYYSIPSRSFVTSRLSRLECVGKDAERDAWVWLYQAEAATLTFYVGWKDVPAERQPLILGRIRFPSAREMTVQVNSIPRAIAAARFFAPHLGDRVVLRRGRVVNRLFAASAGTMDDLARTLDQNVTVIDPADAERQLEEDLRSIPHNGDLEAFASERLERKRARGDDVPLVEDFPLWPEEESSDFRDLKMVLQLRLARAIEHWKGNTDVTLLSLITRLTEAAYAGAK